MKLENICQVLLSGLVDMSCLCTLTDKTSTGRLS